MCGVAAATTPGATITGLARKIWITSSAVNRRIRCFFSDLAINDGRTRRATCGVGASFQHLSTKNGPLPLVPA